MSTAAEPKKFTVKDFTSDQDVRWCPGCGDYSILSSVKKVLAEKGIAPEQAAFISGIGCSSRFPYYMETYGMHSIHGRAMAVASGLKIARQDLEVFVITGDGDALSIGGNHTLHTLRRNVNINVLLFNNQIYGLTKGQYSPTSPFGQKTKSTPDGSLDRPIQPLSVALAAEATFVARAVDMHPKHLTEVIKRAVEHKGSSFVEIYQNCVIFNNGAFDYAEDRKLRPDNVIELRHGEPLLFGQNMEKGIILHGREMKVVTLGENGFTKDDVLVHDEKGRIAYHYMLARMNQPDLPEPIGVLRAVERPTYDDLVANQIESVIEKRGKGDLQGLLRGKSSWEVKPAEDNDN